MGGLKISDQGEILQAVVNFHHPQRILIDIFTHIPQRLNIHVQLEGFLLPDANVALSDYTLVFRRLGDRLPIGGCGSGTPLPGPVACISFQDNFKALTRTGLIRQDHHVVEFVYGAGILPINGHQGLSAHIYLQGNHGTLNRFRQADFAPKPAVFPL